jgi:formate hydrogenlyase subunit 4
MLIEPAFFILMGSFALFTAHASFSELYSFILIGETTGLEHGHAHLAYLLGGLAIYLLAQIAMVENSRLPVDDPRTHLELTMVHEVMVLDNSGFDMGLIQLGTGLKFALYGSLIANCLFIKDASLGLNLGIFFLTQLTFAVVVGVLESFRARNKMLKNAQFLLTLSGIALLAFFTVLILTEKIQG